MSNEASKRELKIFIIENLSEKKESGTLKVQFWDKKERFLRALKIGAMSWGAAAVAVLIPGMHFFLVPGFLIAGPILAYYTAGQRSRVVGGEGICPACHAAFVIAPAALQFPLSDLCNLCQKAVKIELADPSDLVLVEPT